MDYPAPLPDPPPPDKQQLEKVIRKLSPYKAPGPDGIPNIVLQKCFDLIADHILQIYKAILTLEVYYDPWREFSTIVLRKPNKPNYEVPKAYRPIALISTMAKVLTALIADNVSQLVEQHRLLPNTHFGGRPGRTTTDAIHYLVHRVKQAWANGQVASVLFLDVEGAFPNAVTDKLLHNLKKRRIPQIYVKFIKLMLSNRRTKLSFDDYTSDPINILNGIGQGDPLSMILYILYNADILEIIDDETHEGALGYVDDMALIATGNSFEDMTEILRNLMEKQDGGLSWSETHNSRFEMSKSAVLHFTRKTMMDPEDENNRIPVPKPPLTIGGQTIEEVQSYKYLGIQIDAQLRWKEQAQRAVANATKWLLQYRRLTRPTTGTSSRLMRQLYIAVALPKITYGLDIWYIPPSKKAGQTKNSGSAGALRQLQKVQRIASLAINGALRMTPTDFLDAHAGLLPIEFALLKAAHRATIRLLTLPDTHPLYGIVKSTRDSPPTRHLSPIASLIKTFKLRRKKIETIRPAAQYPQVKAKFATETQKSREESIKQEKEDKSDFKVFSDGSGAEDGIGAAAVLYRKGRFSPVDKLKAFLGPPERHNTFEAEVVGAILAAQLLSSRPDAIGKTATIYIDNQSVIASLKNPKATAGQYLIRHLLHTANSLPCKLRLCWISGHSNVKGNEKVDELAKEAAEGNGSEAERLPQILRTQTSRRTSESSNTYGQMTGRSRKGGEDSKT